MAALHPTGTGFNAQAATRKEIRLAQNPPDLHGITIYDVAELASIETLFEFCSKIAEHLKIQRLDGIPLDEWFWKQKLTRIEAFLLSLEGANPRMAAQIRQVLANNNR
jgi:hypothetical protein